MTMTHKEAMRVARDAARGHRVSMSPKKMTLAQKHAFIVRCSSAEEAQEIYDAALAAAPDPFKEEQA